MKGKEVSGKTIGKDGKDKPSEPISTRKSLQQLQEEKKKERELEELLKLQIEQESGFSMGPSCESRICGTCQITVEEFGIYFYFLFLIF